MANFKQWVQRVFAGENDLEQPSLIPEGYVASSINLLPKRDSRGLVVRDGFTTSYTFTGKNNVLAIFRKRKLNGSIATLVAITDITNSPHTGDGDLYMYYSGDDFATAPTQIYKWTDVLPTTGAWFSDWDGDRIFFSFGALGGSTHELYTWDFVMTDTGGDGTVDSWIKVQDVVPDPDVDAPDMKYIVNFRGRLFGAMGSTIYFCGTDDTGNPRWKQWSFGASTGTQAIIDDGGSMVIQPFGEEVIGLRPSKEGLLVFKENSIVLWSWSDSGAPWEVQQGAKTEILAHNIGLISHEACVRDGDGYIFAAKDPAGAITIYGYLDGDITAMSADIPNKFAKLSSSQAMHLALFDNLIFIIARLAAGTYPEIHCVFDIATKGWFGIDAPYIECVSTGAPSTFQYLGGVPGKGMGDGRLLKYPSGVYHDNTSTDITWSLKLAALDLGAPFDDKFFRVFWVEAGAGETSTINVEFDVNNAGGRSTHTSDPITVSGVAGLEWGDDTPTPPVPADLVWGTGLPGEPVWDATGTEEVKYVPLGMRGVSIQPTISGTVDNSLYINAVGVGYRDRKPRSVV